MGEFEFFKPDQNLMENELNESQCSILFDKIKSVIESDNWKGSYIDNFGNYEYYKNINEADIFSMGVAVIVIIASLIKYIKNKYSLNAKKILNQTKELNDIYTKVNYMLENDKVARFKHRDDRVDTEIWSIVLIDKKDGKVYKYTSDFIAYNPKYFVNKIDHIMSYSSSKPETEKYEVMDKMINDTIAEANKFFMDAHGFVVTCDPFMKVATYNDVRLEDALMEYKKWIEVIYKFTGGLNNNVSNQTVYLQYLNQAYAQLMNRYGKDKKQKDAIDRLFKVLIKNMTLSMDYNNRSITIFENMMRHYVKELNKIYDIIRS